MAEEQKLDPRDLNGDGKVTFDEKVKYVAAKAGEKISVVAENVKEKSKDLYEKAAPKAKEAFADLKEKGADLAEKAKDKISGLTGKKEEEKEA